MNWKFINRILILIVLMEIIICILIIGTEGSQLGQEQQDTKSKFIFDTEFMASNDSENQKNEIDQIAEDISPLVTEEENNESNIEIENNENEIEANKSAITSEKNEIKNSISSSDSENSISDLDVGENSIEEELINLATSEGNIINNCQITYYCAEQYEHICNAGYPYTTATGTTPTPNHTCAVDPNIIPYNSIVFVKWADGKIGIYIAEDCGGSINGNKIDILVATHSEALENGIQNATVYWVLPEEK